MNKVSQEKHVTLNRPALWKAVPSAEIGSRKYTANRSYLDGNVIKIADTDAPITAYYKTFTKGKNDFSLFVYSDEEDIKKISEFFDKIVKNTKIEDIAKALVSASSDGFTYLDTYYKGDKK